MVVYICKLKHKNVKKIKSPLSRRKTALLAVALLVLISVGVYAAQRRQTADSPAPTITAKDGKKVTLAPPTKQEKQEVEDHKSELAKNAAASSSASATQTKTSSVIITSPSSSNPSQYGVRAYVSGVFEEGGTCTATATQGGASISKTSLGFGNVSYTQCAPIDWDSPLGVGRWSIAVSYKSATTSSSQSVTIEVK